MSLDDRLAGLRDVPAPPLAGAAAARARGAQRTRRTRSVLAGTAAVVAVVSVSAVSALTSGGDGRTAPPVASTAPQAETPLQAALLDADDVSAALQQDWRIRSTQDLPFAVDLPGCTSSGVSGEQALRSFTGPDAEVLGTGVEVFADRGAAEQHFTETAGRLSTCPQDQVALEAPSGPADSVRGRVTDDAGSRAFSLALVGRVVVLLLLDGADLRPELVDRADAEVRAAFPTGPAPTPPPVEQALLTAERSFDAASAFLSPEDASSAEQPGWAVAGGPVGEEPLLDPCGDGELPLTSAVVELSERILTSQREAGGSELQQEVHEYRDAASAEAALAAYREAYERCPGSPSGESSSELLPVDGERLLVRQSSCPVDCGAPFASYAFVVRSAFAVTVVRYAVGEDGDPAEPAARLLDAVGSALTGAVHESTPVLAFRTPVGSTTCLVSVLDATCETAAEYAPPPRPADCDLDWGPRLTLDGSGARFACHSDALGVEGDAAVLPYGTSAENESFTCSSSPEGVRCRQRDGAAGFLLSRDRYELT